MNYDDLLYKYFDGETSPEENNALKEALRNDKSLKDDYKLMKKMEKTYPKIVKSYKPAIIENKQVFDSLGLKYRDRRFLFTGFMFGGLPILTALLLTVFFFSDLSFSAKSSKSPANEEDFGNPFQTFSQKIVNSDNAVNNIADKVENSTIKNHKKSAEPISREFVENTKTSELPKAEMRVRESLEGSSLSSISRSNSINISSSLPEAGSINANGELINSSKYDQYWNNDPEKNDKWSVELKYSNSWLSPAPTIDPRATLLNNVTVAGYYKLSDDFGLGLEMRQERFFLDYYKYNTNIEYYYEQQPNLLSFGVSGKYYPIKLGFISPFIQAGAGLNHIAFVTRGGIGFEVELYKSFGFVGMGEYNRMYYNFENSWYGTGKFSLHGGIIYKF